MYRFEWCVTYWVRHPHWKNCSILTMIAVVHDMYRLSHLVADALSGTHTFQIQYFVVDWNDCLMQVWLQYGHCRLWGRHRGDGGNDESVINFMYRLTSRCTSRKTFFRSLLVISSATSRFSKRSDQRFHLWPTEVGSSMVLQECCKIG